MIDLTKVTYTLTHRKAFMDTQKALLGRVTLSGYLHDLDKVLLLCLGLDKKLCSKIHRFLSSHHTEGITLRQNYQDMVIDWQCASITKSDKPLDARQTCLKYYSNISGSILPICDKLGI